VRAASPWPGAYTELAGETLTLVRVRARAKWPRALAPGEAAVEGDTAFVRTGDGALDILEARDEDDTPLSAANLAARVRRSAG
jgi:methionyl-tRNA formyltransferase